MTPSGFQLVLQLNLPHQVYVLIEQLPHHLLMLLFRVESQSEQSPAEEHE